MIDFSTEIADEGMELKVRCLVISENETRKEFLNVNANKAKGPGGLTGKRKTCASQLWHIYSHIFNLSLSTSSIPNIWKTSKIIPVPKKEKVTTVNDLRPVALTPFVMKCFERKILKHLTNEISPLLDPLQFAYQPKRSVEDALIVFSNYIFSHLDNANTYCRILFIDFSSALNTIKLHLLVNKPNNFNVNEDIISWVLEFLSNRPHYVFLNTLQMYW